MHVLDVCMELGLWMCGCDDGLPPKVILLLVMLNRMEHGYEASLTFLLLLPVSDLCGLATYSGMLTHIAYCLWV
jgi:hypothetical protein